MKQEDYRKILNDNNWIKISYHSKNSFGQILMKESLYVLREKKLKRLLKDTEFDIVFNYQLTLSEYEQQDDELRCINRRIYVLEKKYYAFHQEDTMGYLKDLKLRKKEIEERIFNEWVKL